VIYEDETSWAKVGEQAEQAMKEHRAFDQNYGDATAGGATLHPTTMATSIRKDASGAFTVTEAPLRRPRVCASTVTSKTEE
jgi:hypothetical protein